MPKTRTLLIVVVMLLLLPTSLVHAQADPLPNRFVVPGDDLSIGYPHGWNVEFDREAGTVFISSSLTGIVTNWLHAEDLPSVGIVPGDAVAALSYFFSPLDDSVAFDPARVTQQTVDGRTVYVYKYQDRFDGAPYDGVLAASQASDGSFFVGDIFGLETAGVDAADVREALRIVAAVQFPAAASTTLPDGTGELFGLLDSGIGVVVPDGWSDYVDEDGFLTMESLVTVMEPHWYVTDDLLALEITPGDAPAVLEDLAGLFGLEFDPASVSVSQVSERPVWHTTFEVEDTAGQYEVLLAAVPVDNGAVLAGLAYPAIGDTLTEQGDVLAILASARPLTARGPGAELLSESFSFETDGITFYFPATWTVEIDDDFVYLASNLSYADPYYTLVEDLDAHEVGDPGAGLAALWDALYSAEGMAFDPSAVQMQFVGDYRVMSYAFNHADENGAHEHLLTAVELEDGSQFYLDAYPIRGSTLVEADTVLDITASATALAGLPSLGEERVPIRLDHRR